MGERRSRYTGFLTHIRRFSNHNVEILVVHFYYNTKGGKNVLYHSESHAYVLQPGISNDLRAVVAALRQLLRHYVFNHGCFDCVDLFSDGGPKHFKNCAAIHNDALFAFLLHSLGFNFTHHFFASNHGSGACDADASHFKIQLHNWARSHEKRITAVEELVEHIKVKYLTASILEIPEDLSKISAKDGFPKLKGIRHGYHCFKYGERGVAYAWHTSYDEAAGTAPLCYELRFSEGIQLVF